MANSGVALKLAGKSSTSPKEQKQGKVCYVDVFKLTDLPGIMDQKGWKVSAAIMRKWLESEKYLMSKEEKEGETDSRQYPSKLVDTSIVTMSWALSFPRIKKEYDSIFGGTDFSKLLASTGFFKPNPAKYESVAARRELVKRLSKAGKFTLQQESFGNLQAPVTEVNDLWQFQYHVIGGKLFNFSEYGKAAIKETFLSDPDLDDMWGALADCLMKIAGEGTVTPKIKKVGTGLQVEYYEVSVKKIGVYIRDTYDFNGEQYLGHWSKTSSPYVRLYLRGESRGDCPDDYVEVNNDRFRAHQALTGKGGDLLIFSDVLVTQLSKPFTFKITPQEI